MLINCSFTTVWSRFKYCRVLFGLGPFEKKSYLFVWIFHRIHFRLALKSTLNRIKSLENGTYNETIY